MSHTTGCAYVLQVPRGPHYSLCMQDQLKEVGVTGLYSDLCCRESVLHYVPLAELKMASKVFKINPRNSYRSHLVCLFLLLPAEAVLDEEGAPSSSHRMSGV